MQDAQTIDPSLARKIRAELKADCSKCFGLCCTALHLIASSDFAINKPAGTPCPNLQEDFRCQIHSRLRQTGFKGCTVFDCLGAGQMIAQKTFGGQSWRNSPAQADKMFQAFPVMMQLAEMIAFTAEALSYELHQPIREQLTMQLERLQKLTLLPADDLLDIDLVSCRMPVGELLMKASTELRRLPENKRTAKDNKLSREKRGANWMGKNCSNHDLRGTDLRGAYLIAANLRKADLRFVDFIGADLRDAELGGADLSTSLFLTQMQINSAKGNASTRLPDHIARPSHWTAQ